MKTGPFRARSQFQVSSDLAISRSARLDDLLALLAEAFDA
jgi:hypothetical protein